MRLQPQPIWDIWSKGGPFIGAERAVGRVTVEWDWKLTATSSGAGSWPASKLPIRWFQLCNDSQTEMELPPIKSIQRDQSVDSDAGTCTIVLYNQQMKDNLALQANLEELGQPGYYTMARGLGAQANARWNQTFNQWCFALTPNTLLRTYEGFGAGINDMSIAAGTAAGKLVRTGVWFVDRVKIGTDGLITMECRDAAKLLIEQQLYPPLVPSSEYPLHYHRWTYTNVVTQQQVNTTVSTPGGLVDQGITLSNSTVDMWYPQGSPGSNLSTGGYVLYGHKASDSMDLDFATFSLSVGNSSPTAVYAADWWEYNLTGGTIDTVYMHAWGGNYTMYVSILVGGQWLNEAGGIPWDNSPLYGNQPYVANSMAGIPYVAQFGVPWETGGDYALPHTYTNVQKVRITFRNPTRSQWGPNFYRSGIREFRARVNQAPGTQTVTNTVNVTNVVKSTGNYLDYSDIVRDILLYAGFWCYPDLDASGMPALHASIETTGVFAEDDLPDELFDKRPVIDPITELKHTVGYFTWVDQDGAFHFESPNFWSPGNFDENGQFTSFIPDIDEKIQLTGYSINVSDEMLRSEIIIAEENSKQGPFGTVTRYTPPTNGILRGMVKPAMWSNGYFTSAAEQQTMAQLIGLHIFFRLRMGQVDMWANPCIQINDQVRVYERVTSTTFVHYVRGIQTQLDCDTGQYKMALTTHWLGSDSSWAVS